MVDDGRTADLKRFGGIHALRRREVTEHLILNRTEHAVIRKTGAVRQDHGGNGQIQGFRRLDERFIGIAHRHVDGARSLDGRGFAHIDREIVPSGHGEQVEPRPVDDLFTVRVGRRARFGRADIVVTAVRRDLDILTAAGHHVVVALIVVEDGICLTFLPPVGQCQRYGGRGEKPAARRRVKGDGVFPRADTGGGNAVHRGQREIAALACYAVFHTTADQILVNVDLGNLPFHEIEHAVEKLLVVTGLNNNIDDTVIDLIVTLKGRRYIDLRKRAEHRRIEKHCLLPCRIRVDGNIVIGRVLRVREPRKPDILIPLPGEASGRQRSIGRNIGVFILISTARHGVRQELVRLHEIVACRIGVAHPDILERQGAERGEEVTEAHGIIDTRNRKTIGERINGLIDAHAGIKRHRFPVRDRIPDGAVIRHGIRRTGRPGDCHAERGDARGEKQVTGNALAEPGERLQMGERPRAERGKNRVPVRTEHTERKYGISDRETCRLRRRKVGGRRQHPRSERATGRCDVRHRQVVGERTERLCRRAGGEPLAENLVKPFRKESDGTCLVATFYRGERGIDRRDSSAVCRRHFADVQRGGLSRKPYFAVWCPDPRRKRCRRGDCRFSGGDGQDMTAEIEDSSAQVENAIVPQGDVRRQRQIPRENHRRGEKRAVGIAQEPRVDIGGGGGKIVTVGDEEVGTGIGILRVIGNTEFHGYPGESLRVTVQDERERMRIGAAAGDECQGIDRAFSLLGEVCERIDKHAVTIDEDGALHGGDRSGGESAGRARHGFDRNGVPVRQMRFGIVFERDGESDAVPRGAEYKRGTVSGDCLPADELRHRHREVIAGVRDTGVTAPAHERAEKDDGGGGQRRGEENRRGDDDDE